MQVNNVYNISVDQQLQEMDIEVISSDKEEPIILIRGFHSPRTLSEIQSLVNSSMFESDSHVTVRDESFNPAVIKHCTSIETLIPSIQEEARRALNIVTKECLGSKYNDLGLRLQCYKERRFWGGPGILAYRPDGFMTSHRDKAKIDNNTGLPMDDGLLITMNLGLTCSMYLETRRHRKYGLSIPSGSVIIFDPVLTQHSICGVLPGSCPEELGNNYPFLREHRLAIISRQRK